MYLRVEFWSKSSVPSRARVPSYLREQCVSLRIEMAITGHSEPTLLTIGVKWPSGGDAAFYYWGLSGWAGP